MLYPYLKWDLSVPTRCIYITATLEHGPYKSSWRILTEVMEALDALDAANLVLVYDDDTPVMLGACPSSGASKDPLEIKGFKSGNSYNVSVFYRGDEVLLLESPSPMLGETVVFSMIAVLVQELESMMKEGEPLKPLRRIRDQKHGMERRMRSRLRRRRKESTAKVTFSINMGNRF